MTTPAIKLPASYQGQIALLRFRNLPKLAVCYLGIQVAAFLSLGFAFAVLCVPLTLVFAHLAFIYNPAYQLLGRLLGARNLPARLAKPPGWYLLYSIAYVTFLVAVSFGVVWILFRVGFCNQNLICLAATRLGR